MPVRAQSDFVGGAEILAFAKEDSWADCDLRGAAWPVAVVAEGRYDLLLHAHRSKRGDGCLVRDLRCGAGTTLVDQLRPASSWRCRCLKFRSGEARNGTSFGVEQIGKLSVVAPKCRSRWGNPSLLPTA
jgi:hypothetical protein